MKNHRQGASDRDERDLQWIFRSILISYPYFQNSDVDVSFYPYVGLTHTIRRKGGSWRIRVSDHCRGAPREVLEAICVLLACKVLQRRAPARLVEVYDRFRRDPDLQARLHGRRRQKGRKRIGGSDGRHHSLEEIYRELNERFFRNQICVRGLGWGIRSGWNRLGHFDPVHETITVSPVLDSPSVPRTAVSFVVYHEMLHALFAAHPPGGATGHHPPPFRRAERDFPDFAAARGFLNEYSRSRGKKID